MQLSIDSDYEFTQNFYQADGTTALDLSAYDEIIANFLTATNDLIYAAVKGEGKFEPTATLGEATLKWDHYDNTNSYTGLVFVQYEFKILDASFNSGYKEVKLPPALIFEIIPEIPNPTE